MRHFHHAVRNRDVVARIGGDEFAVLVREFASDTELAAIAQRIIAFVAETDGQMGLGLMRASVGIASYPDRVADYWKLVATADDTIVAGANDDVLVDANARHLEQIIPCATLNVVADAGHALIVSVSDRVGAPHQCVHAQITDGRACAYAVIIKGAHAASAMRAAR